MRTLSIINQKGGSGKTTTAINLASAVAASGRRTLLVDLDPQSHCALGLAVPESHIDLQIGDALLAPDHRLNDLSRMTWIVGKDLTLIPSTTKLAGLEAARGGLADREDRDTRLSSFLSRLADQFDWCIVDCPPFIGLLTYNALRASSEVLIPVETAYFALQGAIKQVNTIRAMCRRFGASVPFRILPTLYDPASPLAGDVMKELGRRFERHLIPVTIRVDPKLREAASLGVPLGELDPHSTGAQDYQSLAAMLTGDPVPAAEAIDASAAQLSLEGPSVLARAEADEHTPKDTGESEVPTITPPAISHPRQSPQVPMTRAAELAARAKRLAARSAEITRRLESDPEVAQVMRELEETGPALAGRPREPVLPRSAPSVARLLGAHPTSRGVLFVQPGREDARICVAGDHNGWSPTATPLRYNPQVGAHEACVPLPPGRFRYRLVIDGIWLADPHNPIGETNPYGERDSVVVIEPAEGAIVYSTNEVAPAREAIAR